MKRNRLTNEELETLTQDVVRLASEFGPIGVRGLFYQSVVAGLVDKLDSGYDRIQRIAKDTRLNGQLDWDLITDESRQCYSVSTFDSIEDLLGTALKCFRLDPWAEQPYFLQVWIEKEGLAPLVAEITNKYRVPLYPGKGYSSLSFSREAALQAINSNKKTIVLQWGDYDPSGVNISKSLSNHYALHGASNAEVIRVGLREEHIQEYNLPTRRTKSSDTRSSKFGDSRSVELDAVAPAVLKEWVEKEILKYIDRDKWLATQKREEEEKQRLQQIIGNN